MKIVYVITRSEAIGGAQLHLRDLAAAMQKRGHDVHVLVGDSDGPFFPLLDEVNVSYTKIKNLVRPVSPLTDWRCIGELKKVVKQHSPDLVHCHSAKAGLLGRYAASSLKIPSVFSAHGWSFTEGVKKSRAAVYKVAERMAARWCQRILCGCERDRQTGLVAGIADEKKIETIWYGIHNLDDAPMADPSTQPPNMVMVARFEEQKDHKTLISALGKVKDLGWTVDLLGDGPLRPANEALAAELGIADRINFAGAQPTREFLLKSQFFLLISNWEGLPLSTLEGMRVGLPLIGSDVGGIPEEITDGESGFVVRRGDVDQLADRLRQMISDPDMRIEMGRKGKERFDADFQYERMLARVENVYQRVVEEFKSRN